MVILKEYAAVVTALVFARFEKRVNERLESFERTVNAKFETIDERFERIEGEITTIRSDIKAILLRLPRKADTG